MVDVRMVFEPDLGSRLDQLLTPQRLVGAKVRAFLDVLAAAFPDKVFDPGRV